MSAQIITALRQRADELDRESEELPSLVVSRGLAYTKDAASLHWLASEFRTLADKAEGRAP